MADLTIDVENVLEYQGDLADALAFARNPEITPARANLAIKPEGIGNFGDNIGIDDIVAINGQPRRRVSRYSGHVTSTRAHRRIIISIKSDPLNW